MYILKFLDRYQLVFFCIQIDSCELLFGIEILALSFDGSIGSMVHLRRWFIEPPGEIGHPNQMNRFTISGPYFAVPSHSNRLYTECQPPTTLVQEACPTYQSTEVHN